MREDYDWRVAAKSFYVLFEPRKLFFAELPQAARLKIEDDHTLVWMDPHAAIAALRHDAHAWAVAAWLRRVKRSA